MPYEVSMSGGGPWGFRISGGPLVGKPVTISRVTPGGKAAQANVMQGDVMVAINGFGVSDNDLPEILERVRLSGYELHMTLLSQEEITQSLNKRHSEANFTSITELERDRCQLLTPCSERPPSQIRHNKETLKEGLDPKHHQSPNGTSTSQRLTNGGSTANTAILGRPSMPKITIKVGGKPQARKTKNRYSATHKTSPKRREGGRSNRSRTQSPAVENVPARRSPSPQPVVETPVEETHVIASSCPVPHQAPAPAPEPKPRRSRPKPVEEVMEETEQQSEQIVQEDINNISENEKKKLPDYIRRQLQPAKPVPDFKPQVQWLHGKLRLGAKSGAGLTNPGNTLKAAAAAYPCKRIEIEGPVSATIVHSQYNTPVGMYSANQIVSTLVNTASARGAKVPDPDIFGDQSVPIDTNTAVYKLVHDQQRSSPAPAQSRSIQILDALLDYDEDAIQHFH